MPLKCRRARLEKRGRFCHCVGAQGSGSADNKKGRSFTRRQSRRELSRKLGDEISLSAERSPNGSGTCVFSIVSTEPAGALQLLHYAHDVKRVTVTMVGVDN